MIKNCDSHFENSEIELCLENGILYAFYKMGAVITLNKAKVLVEERLKLCKGSSYPVFIDLTNLKSIDKAARSYLSKEEEGTALITAGAFFINNVVHEVMANFFVHFDKPKIPVSFFSSREKALKWLEPYKVINGT